LGLVENQIYWSGHFSFGLVSRVTNIYKFINLVCISFVYLQVIRFQAIKEGLRSTLLRMIAQERSGGVTNRIGIRNTCEMLIALGLGSLEVYVNFETSFLVESAQFYEVLHFHHTLL
jgi:Cullin family